LVASPKPGSNAEGIKYLRGLQNMEVLTPNRITPPKVFSLPELWLELKEHCPVAPSRSQFYEWLKLAFIVSPQARGGVKQQQIYTQEDLNRLTKFYELRTQIGALKAAQQALLTEIENNPTFYGA
jgi:HEPN domain-containing protein